MMKPELWKRIDEVFDAALELEPQDRAAYLDEACAGDEALRKEIESLLAFDQKANDFIETPVVQATPELLMKGSSKFSNGQRLGPYNILSLLGTGGMGEVYLAEDSRLGRKVAIKALPAHLAQDPDMRRRFEREARVISKLSHPHICSIYDIGYQDNTDYLVMEYIEGETLAERLSKGAISIEQVLLYAIQITDALDKAHRAGIIHRDLKPGNIMLAKSGAKLLDFGLAKLRKADGQLFASPVSPSSTDPASLTAEGMIIGTLQYMAPEQVNGQEADERTDIFVFGAVFYEMLTGKKAFVGNSQASLIAAILTNEPQPVSTIQPLVPLALARTVKTCLAKDPDDRWQTVHDLKMQLKWIAEADSQAGEISPATLRHKRRERFGWITAAVFFAVAVAALAFAYFNRPASTTVSATRFVIPAPEKTSFNLTSQAALSPDGRRLAFVAVSEGKNFLWVRSLDSLTAQPLSGTEGALHPFWSPDSRFIGFFAQGKLKKIEISGGAPQMLCDSSAGNGGTWNREGVILFAQQRLDVIYRVPAVGGVPSPVTTLNPSRHEYGHAWPHFLPDGRHFLYNIGAPQEQGGIYIGSLDSKETKRLLTAESNAAYAEPGYLFFVRETTLLAQPFDVERLQLTGEPFSVAEPVWFSVIDGYAAFSVSQSGVLEYEKGGNVNKQLVWFDRLGKQLEAVGTPGEYQSISLSPDEKRVAVERHDPKTRNVDIWILDLPRGIWSRLTSDPGWDYSPIWSPDGNRIIFGSIREGPGDLYQIPASGGSDELLLKSNSGVMFPTQYSRDGRFIIYQQNREKTKRDLWTLSMSGERQPQQFFQTEFNEFYGALSPDGRWMAYVSDETGKPEVYVQPFPMTGNKRQISTNGGSQVKWRGDGKEIFYIAPDDKFIAVEVTPGAEFKISAPKDLFLSRTDKNRNSRYHYAVTADGQRFLVNTIIADAAPSPINVVVNWTADLKK